MLLTWMYYFKHILPAYIGIYSSITSWDKRDFWWCHFRKYLLQVMILRSSLSQMFFKMSVLKNIAIFTGKHLYWSLFLIKLQVPGFATLLKRDFDTGAFLWNFRNFEIFQIFKNSFFCRALPVVVSGFWQIRRQIITVENHQ